MSTWNDFNSADTQSAFSLIPKGTIARVRMTIRPGGYNDPAQGWTGGYATYGDKSGSVYLNGEFTVLEGPYAKRKVFTLVGLFSTKGPPRLAADGLITGAFRLGALDLVRGAAAFFSPANLAKRSLCASKRMMRACNSPICTA